jgi:hypothetical protein
MRGHFTHLRNSVEPETFWLKAHRIEGKTPQEGSTVMADQFIWIVVDEAIVDSEPTGKRDGQQRGNVFDDSNPVRTPGRRGMPVNVDKLEQGMTDFLQVVGRVLSHAQQRAGELAGMELDEIELSVEVNGEGQLSLLGSGGKVGGKGAMTLKLASSNLKCIT